MTYGLPGGTRITYGAKGFPPWVYQLGGAFGLRASTYPGHQESDRNEVGFAPNPHRLNRGIDWVGSVDDMQRFADYLLSIKNSLEQVIWSSPGRRVGVAGGRDVSTHAYYGDAWAGHRDHVHTRQSAPIPLPGGPVPIPDPFTGALWSPSRRSRSKGAPRWIAVHTQEGGRTARGLAQFLADPANKVSYHAVCDEHEALKVVRESDAPWAAAGANEYAYHLCFAGSFAGWSRNKWLETDAADGKNEDLQLTRGAHITAWWCHKYNVPPSWIGGTKIPPWGLEGVCGHQDFGSWGGGHTDPGPNFPADEFMRRVRQLLTGVAQPPLPVLPPVAAPGTDPGKYGGVLLYRGRRNDTDQVQAVQRRLRDAYRAYAGHLAVDGDFGARTEAAVREFQRRSGIVVDGIVGPMTAAALKPW